MSLAGRHGTPALRAVYIVRSLGTYARPDSLMKPIFLLALAAALAGAAAHPAPLSAQDSVKGLPLKELMPAADTAPYFVVVISGDGGWIGPAPTMAERFRAAGAPIVGWSALHYFWHRKTTDEIGADMTRVLRHYFDTWHKSRVVLLGYSRGADVLPFMISRLPADLRSRIALVGLVGPEHMVDLKLHLNDLWGSSKAATSLATLPETRTIAAAGLPIVCVYGEEETDTTCPDLAGGSVTVVPMKGGHHLDGDFADIGDMLVRRLSDPAAATATR